MDFDLFISSLLDDKERLTPQKERLTPRKERLTPFAVKTQ